MLSPLLFIIALESLSREIKSKPPEELLCADDVVSVCESLADSKWEVEAWK